MGDSDIDTDDVTTDDTRPSLTRDRILEAAVALADEHGIDALSMRKLSKDLGFEVMSLYNHVDNKDDLLDGMVDVVAAEVVALDPNLAWRAAVREIACSTHDALMRHRWAAALWSSQWPKSNRWRLMDDLLCALQQADLPDDIADLGFHAVTMHVQGFTQQQITYSTMANDEAEMFERFSEEVSPEVYPHVVDHVRYHQESTPSHDEFSFVLDLILDGLERLATRR